MLVGSNSSGTLGRDMQDSNPAARVAPLLHSVHFKILMQIQIKVQKINIDKIFKTNTNTTSNIIASEIAVF